MKFKSNFNIQFERPEITLAQFELFIQNNQYNIEDMDMAICYTSYYGSLELFERLVAFEKQYLIDNNINQLQYRDIFSINDNEPIHNAIGKQNLAFIKYLINNGVDISNASDGHLGSYPGMAASEGDLDTLQYLIEDLKLDYHLDNDYPFMIACIKGHSHCRDYLYTKGISISGLNYALEQCCEHGKLESIKFLINHGANIRCNGNNPLIVACRNGHLSCVEYLYSKNAYMVQPVITSTNKNNNYTFIVNNEEHKQILETHSNNFIHTNYYITNKNPILAAACSSGNVQIVEFLIKEKINLSIDMENILQQIVSANCFPILDLFVENKVQLSAYDLIKISTLHDQPMLDYLLNNKVSFKKKIPDIINIVEETNNFDFLDYFVSHGLTHEEMEPFITTNIKRYFFHNNLQENLMQTSQKEKKIKI